MANLGFNSERLIRNTARIFSVIFGAWWLLFGLLTMFVSKGTFIAFLTYIVVPVIFFATVIYAWHRERIGGILLILESVFILFWFIWPIIQSYLHGDTPIGQVFNTAVTKLPFTIPSLISGILFCMLPWRKNEII
jgi:hypothetical protein